MPVVIVGLLSIFVSILWLSSIILPWLVSNSVYIFLPAIIVTLVVFVVHRASCGHCWSSVCLCQYPMAVINMLSWSVTFCFLRSLLVFWLSLQVSYGCHQYVVIVGHQFCLHPTSCCHCQSNNVCCSSYLLWSFLVFCLSLSVSYGCHQYAVMLGTFCFL